MDYLSINNNNFRIIKLLGHGKGGYSYLVEDENNKKFVLKQIHHEPCSYYQFGNKIEDEVHDYQRLKNAKINVPELYHVDYENERLLKEYIEGETIVYFVKNNLMKPIYYEQINKMVELLKEKNLNIDFYPTNFVVQNDEIFYIDFECNEYCEEWNYVNWGSKYWTKTVEFCRDFEK
jgi:tRNA A-37 threonylcarbamoyl transferase component Bud32